MNAAFASQGGALQLPWITEPLSPLHDTASQPTPLLPYLNGSSFLGPFPFDEDVDGVLDQLHLSSNVDESHFSESFLSTPISTSPSEQPFSLDGLCSPCSLATSLQGFLDEVEGPETPPNEKQPTSQPSPSEGHVPSTGTHSRLKARLRSRSQSASRQDMPSSQGPSSPQIDERSLDESFSEASKQEMSCTSLDNTDSPSSHHLRKQETHRHLSPFSGLRNHRHLQTSSSGQPRTPDQWTSREYTFGNGMKPQGNEATQPKKQKIGDSLPVSLQRAAEKLLAAEAQQKNSSCGISLPFEWHSDKVRDFPHLPVDSQGNVNGLSSVGVGANSSFQSIEDMSQLDSLQSMMDDSNMTRFENWNGLNFCQMQNPPTSAACQDANLLQGVQSFTSLLIQHQPLSPMQFIQQQADGHFPSLTHSSMLDPSNAGMSSATEGLFPALATVPDRVLAQPSSISSHSHHEGGQLLNPVSTAAASALSSASALTTAIASVSEDLILRKNNVDTQQPAMHSKNLLSKSSSADFLSSSPNEVRLSGGKQLGCQQSGGIRIVEGIVKGWRQPSELLTQTCSQSSGRLVFPGGLLGTAPVVRATFLTAAQNLLLEVCRCPSLNSQQKKGALNRSGSVVRGGGEAWGREWPKGRVVGFQSGDASKGLLARDLVARGGTREQALRLRSLLNEVNKRYSRYKEKLHPLVLAFSAVAGHPDAATPYTASSLQAISLAFRRIRDAINAQLRLMAA